MYCGFGYSVCLLPTKRRKKFYLPAICEPNPALVVVAHQQRCFQNPFDTIAYNFIPFFFTALQKFFSVELAKIMSKECFVPEHDSLIHFPMPMCWSEVNTDTVKASCFKKVKLCFHPSSSVCWLPLVSFALWM